MHQSCLVEGNDLSHLVEGNQAGLFPSIVFERITRPYPLPPPHTNIIFIPNIKALALVISEKMVFYHVFPRWASLKHVGLFETCAPGQANFVPQCHNLNILGRGQLGDVT